VLTDVMGEGIDFKIGKNIMLNDYIYTGVSFGFTAYFTDDYSETYLDTDYGSETYVAEETISFYPLPNIGFNVGMLF
jgi:hypothetical protein